MTKRRFMLETIGAMLVVLAGVAVLIAGLAASGEAATGIRAGCPVSKTETFRLEPGQATVLQIRATCAEGTLELAWRVRGGDGGATQRPYLIRPDGELELGGPPPSTGTNDDSGGGASFSVVDPGVWTLFWINEGTFSVRARLSLSFQP